MAKYWIHVKRELNGEAVETRHKSWAKAGRKHDWALTEHPRYACTGPTVKITITTTPRSK